MTDHQLECICITVMFLSVLIASIFVGTRKDKGGRK